MAKSRRFIRKHLVFDAVDATTALNSRVYDIEQLEHQSFEMEWSGVTTGAAQILFEASITGENWVSLKDQSTSSASGAIVVSVTDFITLPINMFPKARFRLNPNTATDGTVTVYMSGKGQNA